MKKNSLLIALILFSMFLNAFFRLYTLSLFFTIDTAKDKVYEEISKGIEKDIQANFPDVPKKTKERLTVDRLNKILKSEKKSVNQKIKEKARQLRGFWQDEHGQTYLLEIDPYHWMRLTQNILTRGEAGDMVKDGVQYDTYMLAPFGKPTKANLHIYFGAVVYKIWHILDKNIYLMKALFFVPVFLSLLVVIPAFFICLKLNTGKLGALCASITLGLAPIFLGRSMAGWYDTDVYNIILPLTILWMFIYTFQGNLFRRCIYVVLSAFFVGVYAFSWQGWWYIFDIILLTNAYYIVDVVLSSANKLEGLCRIKPYLISLSLFFISSAVFVSNFVGFGVFQDFYLELIRVIYTKKEILPALWPNVFLTVSELKEINIYQIIELVGNKFIFITSLLGLVILFIKSKISQEKQLGFMFFLLTIWIAVMLYVATKSIRFSLLLCTPIAIGFGIFIGSIYEFLTHIIKNMISSRFRLLINVVLILILFMPLYSLVSYAKLSEKIHPLINDDWWQVLERLKKETPLDAVINSWWDYGHWFKAIATRRVIFDGATQNTPLAYWMARTLLTDNEEEAVGILRMLNCGSDRVVAELERQGLDIVGAVSLTLEILPLTSLEANDVLKNEIPNVDSEKILRYTHTQAPAAYFITDKSLIEKIGSISFLGNWDFKKADIWRRLKQGAANKESLIDYLVRRYKYKPGEASYFYRQIKAIAEKDILDWLSPQFKYYPLSRSETKPQGKILYFDNGLVFNLKTEEAFILDSRNKIRGIPQSLVYPYKDGIREVNYKNSNLSFSVLLMPHDRGYISIEMDTGLTKSMLTRLYFLEGHGLRYFKPYIKRYSEGRPSIYVWQIDWQGRQVNNVFK